MSRASPRWLALLISAAIGCSDAGGGWANTKTAADPAGDAMGYGGVPPAEPMPESGGYPPAATMSTGSVETFDRDEDDNRPARVSREAPADTAAAPPPPPPPGPQQAPKPKPAPGPAPGGVVDDPARKQPILIYTADFTLSVYEVEKSLDAIEGEAKARGGYLSRRDNLSITVRVPAESFQELTAAIEKVGDVLSRNVVSEDVTAEYRDLEVQLANALALRARFEKLLEKAVKVEDALAIEQQLGRVTGQIERIKGRLKLLSDQARYSTITVTFRAKSSQTVKSGPFLLPLPWVSQVGLRRLMQL